MIKRYGNRKLNGLLIFAVLHYFICDFLCGSFSVNTLRGLEYLYWGFSAFIHHFSYICAFHFMVHRLFELIHHYICQTR